MRAYRTIPLTARMQRGLAALHAGNNLDFDTSNVGRPTKQRLAKHGLAEYITPKDWDGPMRLTAKGERVAQGRGR